MTSTIDIRRNKQRDAEQLQTISTAPPSVRLIRDKLKTFYQAKFDLRQHYIYLTF
jgi:hypothetical protein